MSEQDEKRIFAKNLTELLYRNDISQKELAEALGFNQKTVNGWCRGLFIPTMGKVQKIADYFGVGKTDLLNDNGDAVLNNGQGEFYFNKESEEMVKELQANPQMRMVFNAARDVAPEDLEQVIRIIETFKRK